MKRKNSDIESVRTELNIFGDLGRGGSLSLKGYYFDSERGSIACRKRTVRDIIIQCIKRKVGS